MLRGIRLVFAAATLLATGHARSLYALNAYDALAHGSPASEAVVRLEGDEVTDESIAQLAGKAWDRVELIGDKVDASVIGDLRHTASIRSLFLSSPRLSGQLPRLQHVAGLVELRLDGRLGGRDLEALGQFTQLTSLKLPQEMTVNVVGVREIAQLKGLRSLDLYYVNIDDAGIAELAPLVHLEHLDLTHTRVTDEGLKVLAHMPRLKSLQLHRSPPWHIKQQLSDECLESVCELAELERLSLSGRITDEGLSRIAKLPKLKSLSLLNTNISSYGLRALEHSHVEHLTIPSTMLGSRPDGEGAASLRSLKALRSIHAIGHFPSGDATHEWMSEFPKISWTWSS